jgi:L-threonylcarbamoyladenylate synthase
LAIEEIEKVVGKTELKLINSSNPMAPGQLKSHYATSKQLLIGNISDYEKLYKNKRFGIISFFKEYASYPTIVLSHTKNLEEAAQNLFKAMRLMDENPDVDIICAEFFPDEFLGRAINDRLNRAAN